MADAEAPGHGIRRWGPRSLVILAVIYAVSGCISDEEPMLVVFAAASLTEAFTELRDAYVEGHPEQRVDLNFAGSNTLKVQIEQGAYADVYAPASTKYMGELIDRGYILESRDFARNRLVVIVPAGSGVVKALEDLAVGKKIMLVIANEATPIGGYTREVLEKIGREFRVSVLSHVVSEEDSVKGVVSKVAMGEADAGFAYATDIVPLREKVRGIEIPEEFNVAVAYPIGVLKSSRNPEHARAFVDFVLSGEGRAIMEKHGFEVG